MKRLGCLLTLAIWIIEIAFACVLISCGSSKKTTQTGTQADSNVERVSVDSLNTVTTSATSRTSDESETEETITETAIYRYDTSAPKDTATGKHPLIEEQHSKSTTSKGKQRKEREESQTDAQATAQATEQTSSQRTQQTRAEEVQERQETQVPKQIGTIVAVAAVILAALVIVGWLCYKKMQK